MGIVCPEVNRAKGPLLKEEFLELCKIVTNYNK